MALVTRSESGPVPDTPANFLRPSLSGIARTSKTGTDKPTDRNCDRYMALADGQVP